MATSLVLALDELRAGRLDQADVLGRQIVKEAPKDPGAPLLLATIALRRGNYIEASRWADASLAFRSDHPPALIVAGRAALALDQLKQAASYFGRASKLLPNRPEPAFLLCAVQLDSGDPEANSTLDRVLRQFPFDAEGWNTIGASLRKKGQLEAAAVAFGRATSRSLSIAPHINLGSTLLALGRPQEALQAFRRAATIDSTAVEVLLPLAQCLRQTGSLTDARDQLGKLAALKPGNASVFFELGLVCEDLKDFKGAIAAYRNCVEVQGDFAEAYVNLGLALQQSGDLDQALACYRRAIRVQPETFGRIAQALCSAKRGLLWLNPRRLRRSLIA
jgi:tetratricopeptide (TPR) repeat protein